MAYRLSVDIKSGSVQRLSQFSGVVPQLAQQIVGDAAETIARYGKQNLSGTPFTSRTGTHTIQKRSGRGAASVMAQLPLRLPVSLSRVCQRLQQIR